VTCNAENPPASSPPSTPNCSGPGFCCKKRADTLNDGEQTRLNQLIDTHPRLKAGWDVLQQLHGFYRANDRAGALQSLDRSTDLYATGEPPACNSVVDTIIARGVTSSSTGVARFYICLLWLLCALSKLGNISEMCHSLTLVSLVYRSTCD
jgi:hypothetical protein